MISKCGVSASIVGISCRYNSPKVCSPRKTGITTDTESIYPRPDLRRRDGPVGLRGTAIGYALHRAEPTSAHLSQTAFTQARRPRTNYGRDLDRKSTRLN